MRRAFVAALGLILLAFTLGAGTQQQESIAEAARKLREKKKEAPKATKVFTNDNLPTAGKVSVVGTTTAPVKEAGEERTAEGAKPEGEQKGEAYWRGQFAEARAKLRQAEKELDILQREFNLLQVQYYGDPNKALREQFERKEINEQRQKILDKQKEIEQLRQALSNLEDELRRAGAPAAWAREP